MFLGVELGGEPEEHEEVDDGAYLSLELEEQEDEETSQGDSVETGEHVGLVCLA